MRSTVLLAIFFCFSIYTDAARNITDIKNNKWVISREKPISVTDFKNNISDFQLLKDSTFSYFKDDRFSINTIIESTDDQAEKLMISIQQWNNLFDVWVDGQKLENLQQNDIFLAMIDKLAETDGILLTLISKTEKVNEIENFRSVLENITITSISGIVISWLAPGKDQYFGCPKLEIHILNTLDKDIDGKLVARIYKPETFDLIAENNNCAFSRSNMETVIDIIFPDIQSTLIKGNFVAEVQLLDKEKNEEVIDRIKVPIKLE
jgi:hypothetical protein